MKSLTINLRDDSQQYGQFRYPAGEWQVRLPEPVTADYVNVVARIGSFDDIGKLALLKNAIGHKPYSRLILPYLPYSRADRQFTPGDCCGLEVFGELLGPMRFNEVVTLDVHNAERAHFYIANLIDKPADLLIQTAIVEFARRHSSQRITVLFPDEGARKRYVMPPMIACNTGHIDLDVLHCEKRRNAVTGALEGFRVPSVPDQPSIIIDDICDGGGTFIGIANASQLLGIKCGLYVTHGIFSKGVACVMSHFDQIYTTNTFAAEYSHPLLQVQDAMPILLR